jgi:hypothetical protein
MNPDYAGSTPALAAKGTMSDSNDNKPVPPLRLVHSSETTAPAKPKHTQRQPLDELVQSGLLQEINRRVLHPFGLSLNVVVDDEDGSIDSIVFHDFRDKPEDLLYSPSFLDESRQRLKVFLEESGYDRLARRRRFLGFELQGKDELLLEGEDE